MLLYLIRYFIFRMARKWIQLSWEHDMNELKFDLPHWKVLAQPLPQTTTIWLDLDEEVTSMLEMTIFLKNFVVNGFSFKIFIQIVFSNLLGAEFSDYWHPGTAQNLIILYSLFFQWETRYKNIKHQRAFKSKSKNLECAISLIWNIQVLK